MQDGVKLSYGELRDYCQRLDNHAGTIETIKDEAEKIVESFTVVWTGQAEKVFQDDYTLIVSSLSQAMNTMREVTSMVRNYVNDMEEVESAYGGGSHVSIG